MSIGSNKKWVATTERFIVFLDIMGFKDKVARNTHKNIYLKLQSLSKTIYLDSNGKNIHCSIFSDSIAIFSRNKSKKAFDSLIWATANIFIHSLCLDLPLKGCLSYGTVTVDRDSNIFFGQPIIDAYLLEENLEYFGVVLHHTAEKAVNSWKLSLPYFIELPIKFKTGVATHINLIWPSFYEVISSNVSPRKNYCLDPLKLISELKMTMSGKPRGYLDNTIKFINEVKKSVNNGFIYADSDS